MNPKFLKREVNFLLLLFLFTLLLFATHWYISFHFFDEIDLILPLYTIYGFHFLTVLIVFTIVNFKFSSGKNQIFPLFMGGTIIKMILCLVFLLPVLLNPNDNAITEVFNFFIPYFLYLAFEIINITLFLKEE
jgi:hypothetical protein